MVDPRRHVGATIVHVLREDAGLAEAIPVAERSKAIDECIAAVVRIGRGRWSGHQIDIMPDGIGLLVLHGLLIRRVGVSGGFGAELLGDGDLLRPWQEEDRQPTLPRTTGWRVLQPARVAVPDRAAAGRFAWYRS
jgi:CRP/FNR family cyclic AMP-dependent transcriptional regulator